MGDILLSRKGKLQIENGGLRVSSNKQILLSQYLQAALLYAVRIQDLNLNREIDLQMEDTRAALELQLQYQIVNSIMSTPFNIDFIPTAFRITLSGDRLETARVRIEYGSDGISIDQDISMKGALIDLNEEELPPYEPKYTLQMIQEEIILDKESDIISVALGADGLAIVSYADKEIEEIEITVDTSTIPEESRHLITINDAADPILVESFESDTDVVTLGYMSNWDANALSEIFFRDLIQNNDPNIYPINITDLSNNIYGIRFIESVNDYLIQFRDIHPVCNIKYTIIDSIAEGIDVVNTDTYQRSEISMVPFPTDSRRGLRFIKLNKILDPGIYNVFYIAQITKDSSMEII